MSLAIVFQKYQEDQRDVDLDNKMKDKRDVFQNYNLGQNVLGQHAAQTPSLRPPRSMLEVGTKNPCPRYQLHKNMIICCCSKDFWLGL
jgi:hypothetical protein